MENNTPSPHPSLSIEVINRCPNKCVFCPNKKIPRPYHLMDMDLFKKIINEYVEGGGKHIGLSCSQSDLFMDPLLLERFEFLASIKKKYGLVISNFNSLILAGKYNDKDLKFILSNIDILWVSVLGTNKENYFLMSGIDGFDKFMKNLERVEKIISINHLNTVIRLSFRTDNLKSLQLDPIYKELLKKFKDCSMIEKYHDWYGKIDSSDLPETVKLISADNSKKNNNCVFSDTIGIQPNGDVIGCICIDWCSEYIFGNARNNNIYEIYESPVAKEFRNGFSLGKIPDMCSKCAIYVGSDRKDVADYFYHHIKTKNIV